MKILYNWLKEFADVSAPAAELRSRLSMTGVSIDSVEETAAGPVLDAEITINRPDLLSHLGIAREAATIYRLPLKTIQPKLKELPASAAQAARVEIAAGDLCRRYTARIVRGVKVQPSPEWLRQRLEALGHSSINNVVDVTNYVMLELGQPLHAFDLSKIAEQRIIVRAANAGETIRTLDGVERKLSKGMCLICDARAPVAIGGVMGGAASEISVGTRDILIESAWFDPVSIRRTSKTLGLRTEASMRFERGANIEMAALASKRAAQLIQELAGGEIASGSADVYPHPAAQRGVELSRRELLRVMGADVPDREIEEILAALGFAPMRVDANRGSAGSLVAAWACTVPSWRGDVTREIDLIEEVARHHGYENFPSRLPPSRTPAARPRHAAEEERLRGILVALGYREMIAIPLVNAERDALFREPEIAPAQIANPLSEDASVMRSSGAVSMCGALEWNVNHDQKTLRLFEFGKSYEVQNGKPVETHVLTLGAIGFAREQSIYEAARTFSFADLKGELDQILKISGGATWEPVEKPWIEKGNAARITLTSNRSAIGYAGRLAEAVAQRFKLRQEVYIAELQLEPLLRAMAEHRTSARYEPLPRFPAVERDFSLLLPEHTKFAQIERAVQALAIPELRGFKAVDLFRGGQVAAGKYSLLLRVTFQSETATLTDAQLADFSARIASALGEKIGAVLRSA